MAPCYRADNSGHVRHAGSGDALFQLALDWFAKLIPGPVDVPNLAPNWGRCGAHVGLRIDTQIGRT